jgi:hypothetical protein
MILLLWGLARQDLLWVYGSALVSFSIGLSIAESWVKRRFAPELLEPRSNWWPSKG